MAIVKANAYGYGLETVAKILADDPQFKKQGWFGVDSLEEALALKKIFEAKLPPTLILGYTPEKDLEEVVANGFRQVVYRPETVAHLQYAAARLKKIALVHLKLESGTNRQGVGESDLPAMVTVLKECDRVRLEGAYSHFADVEDVYKTSRTIKDGNPFAAEQFKTFTRLLEHLEQSGLVPKMRHLAASAAALLYKETHFEYIRLGISLYGLYSVDPANLSKNIRLKPVMSWKTVVAQVKTVKKGETVGYGRAWRAARRSRIAILPIGYADGYSRLFGNTARVIINNCYAPIIGRICMNMCMADVTDIPAARAEDEVVIIGGSGDKNVSVEELAALAGTINYEIIARLNPLITRQIV